MDDRQLKAVSAKIKVALGRLRGKVPSRKEQQQLEAQIKALEARVRALEIRTGGQP